MRVITSPQSMQKAALTWRAANQCIGLVPTMGALHEGHTALIEKMRPRVDRLIVSIYVNPSQFGPKEDLAKYPKPRACDLALCRKLGVDVVFAPFNLYPKDFSTWAVEENASQGRCGQSRPGHFRGVATVVLKLFHLTQPHLAAFGRKDAQQLDVVTRMARDLDLPIQILPVETVRDADGLALSSRNIYLSAKERSQALALPRLLKQAVSQKNPVAWLEKKLTQAPGLRLDYVELASGRLCAAVWAGKTRLIDNIPCRGANKKASKNKKA